MMKQFIFTGVLLLASAVTGEAMANCSTNRVATQAALSTLFTGNTMCVAKAGGGWDAQEEHFTLSGGTGQLWDYKCGPAGTAAVPGTACAKPGIDTKRQVGTWTLKGISSNGTIAYTYNQFGSTPVLSPATGGYYVFRSSGILNQTGSTYDFCIANGSGTPVVSATLNTGTTTACH